VKDARGEDYLAIGCQIITKNQTQMALLWINFSGISFAVGAIEIPLLF
jgi:hypothetical protein